MEMNVTPTAKARGDASHKKLPLANIVALYCVQIKELLEPPEERPFMNDEYPALNGIRI
jgi:hypothetical protein